LEQSHRPDILYHYTTQEGLLGILKEGVIRASSIQHLNDSSEFTYAVKIGLDALERVTELPALIKEHLTTYLKGLPIRMGRVRHFVLYGRRSVRSVACLRKGQRLLHWIRFFGIGEARCWSRVRLASLRIQSARAIRHRGDDG
jgi:hypothetical protein